jgi:DNA repair exonuclease SbcCD ATPase subunit
MENLKEKIENVKGLIKSKQAEIDNFEIDQDDFIEQYEDALNSEGEVKVCGMTFYPADIIKELDPTAYRCGLNDYVDGIDKNEVKAYQELEEELEELENELSDLEEELESVDVD